MDAALGVVPAQVELDRLRRQEQLGGDLAVRSSTPHGRGDTQLLRGQAVAVERAASPRASGAQLGFGLVGPRRRAKLVERVQRLTETFTSLGPPSDAM